MTAMAIELSEPFARGPEFDSRFKAELISLVPHLRAFARNLCRHVEDAEDLAQEAMLKAWRSRNSYTEGTSLRAWTFTILRNGFYSEKRRSWRSQPLDPEVAASTLVAINNPDDGLELASLRKALNTLPDDQREALILVGASGLPYEQVAEICGIAVGTVKSRVSRARVALKLAMEATGPKNSLRDSPRASVSISEIFAEANRLSLGQ